MFAAEDRGEVPEGTAERWAHETPNIKKLPEHKKKDTEKKSSDREVSMTLEEKVIDAFQMCDALIGQAEKIAQEKRASVEQIETQIPITVTALRSAGLIDEGEEKEAAAALRDHAYALELLKRAAMVSHEPSNGHSLGEQVDRNGRAAGAVKKASVRGSEGSPYVGVRSDEDKPSDIAFLRGIGIM